MTREEFDKLLKEKEKYRFPLWSCAEVGNLTKEQFAHAMRAGNAQKGVKSNKR
jgi:hypothetical protein